MILLMENWKSFFVIMIPLAIMALLIVCLSIWAVCDIAKNNTIDRERKRELTTMVTWWPIFGLLYYLFSVRPKLNKDN